MLKICTSIVCVAIIRSNFNKKRLISSATIWILCYWVILVFFPLVSEKTYDMENLIDIYSFLGVLCYSLGIIIAERLRISRNDNDCNITYLKPNAFISKKMFIVAFYIFAAAIMYKIGSEGVRSILSGEITSKQMTLGDKYSKSYIFIYALHFMIPFLLALWISSDNKKAKLFSLIIFIICTLLFGFTRLFLMCVLAIIVFHEMRNFSEFKKLYWLLVALIGGIILMTFMNFLRTWGIDDVSDFGDKVSLEYILESTDFGASYKWFNELLKAKSPHIIPISYFKAIYSFIPRSIWSDKPAPISLQILQYIDPVLASSGYSTAGNSVLGEAYAVMDVIGIVVYPIIWGGLTTYLDRKYYYRLSTGNDGCLKNIYYYIFLTFIVISAQRGDWSQYTVIILWLYVLPLYIISKVRIEKERNNISTNSYSNTRK